MLLSFVDLVMSCQSKVSPRQQARVNAVGHQPHNHWVGSMHGVKHSPAAEMTRKIWKGLTLGSLSFYHRGTNTLRGQLECLPLRLSPFLRRSPTTQGGPSAGIIKSRCGGIRSKSHIGNIAWVRIWIQGIRFQEKYTARLCIRFGGEYCYTKGLNTIQGKEAKSGNSPNPKAAEEN